MHLHELPPPKAWEHLESIVGDLLRETWNNVQKNGRSGQEQTGVDYFGRQRHDRSWAGAQVKAKGFSKRVSEKQLRAEVEKAKGFDPHLTHFVLVTSAPNDAVIQRVARRITQEHEAAGLFSVEVWSWDTVTERLCDYPRIVRKHFPQLLVDDGAASISLRELVEQQKRQAAEREERDRPRFRVKNPSSSRRDEAFEPHWQLEKYSGDEVLSIE